MPPATPASGQWLPKDLHPRARLLLQLRPHARQPGSSAACRHFWRWHPGNLSEDRRLLRLRQWQASAEVALQFVQRPAPGFENIASARIAGRTEHPPCRCSHMTGSGHRLETARSLALQAPEMSQALRVGISSRFEQCSLDRCKMQMSGSAEVLTCQLYLDARGAEAPPKLLLPGHHPGLGYPPALLAIC